MTTIQSESLIDLFFTHESQLLTSDKKPVRWIRLSNPAPSLRLPLDYSENELTVQVSNSEPASQAAQSILKATAFKALAYLDTSFALTVDTNKITADSTYQIADYRFEVSKPFTSPSSTAVEYMKYEWSDTPKLESYPAFKAYEPIPTACQPYNLTTLTPLGNQAFLLYGYVIPCKTVEMIDAERVDDINSQATYWVTRSEGRPGNFSVGDGTGLTALFKEVKIQGAPYGETKLEHISSTGDTVYSSIVCPIEERGFLPADFLGTKTVMNGCSIKTLGLSLIAIAQQNRLGLLSSTLKELVFLWSFNKSSGFYRPGLPSFIPKYYGASYQLPISRSTADMCWLGLGIIEACRLLRDRPYSNLIDVPEQLGELLLDLMRAVGATIDPATGLTMAGVDSNGYTLDYPDYGALVLSHLFLKSALELKYDSEIHARAAAAELVLDKTINSPTSPLGTQRSPVELARLNVYKMLWFIHTKDFNSIQIKVRLEALALDVIDKLDSSLSNINDQFPEALTFIYVLQFLAARDIVFDLDYQRWSLQGLLIDLGLGLYSSGSSAPSLYNSAWAVIIGMALPPAIATPKFELHAAAMNAYGTQAFQLLKRMWPSGTKWTSEKAEDPKHGILGSLFQAIASTTQGWFLRYKYAMNAVSLELAQGHALDSWGRLVLWQRPNLQSDSYYRPKLIYYFQRVLSTRQALVDVLKELLGFKSDEFDIEESSELLKQAIIFYRNSDNEAYKSRYWKGTAEDIDVVKKGNGIEPGFIRPRHGYDDQPPILPWSSVSPRVTVYVANGNPLLGTELDKCVGAGIGLDITVRSIVVTTQVDNSFCFLNNLTYLAKGNQ